MHIALPWLKDYEVSGSVSDISFYCFLEGTVTNLAI